VEVISDLHLHSKYSRAVSQNMTLPVMTQFARQKGMRLLTTGDWTHPLWMREIKANLEESGDGVYSLKNSKDELDPKFILSVEVSSIYSQGGKARRIHCLLFVPNIEAAEKFNAALVKRGANLNSDGRPIVGIKPPELLQILMEIDERSFLIPCHVWTPWFSLYGSMSGFDSIEECFGDMSKYIYGIETGLSSDPAMNWRIRELEKRSILSFSDSPMKMGRESTVFELEELTFTNIKRAIMRKGGKNRISYTIEFYPEEGKYHYTGHRNCKVVYSPEETREKGTNCPVCGKGLTVGVMEQVEKLADSKENSISKTGKSGVKWFSDPLRIHPPYAKLVPLNEVIAETMGVAVGAMKVKAMFDALTQKLGPEFEVLLKTPIEEIAKVSGDSIAESVQKVRNGNIFIDPGYDGEYGVVKIEALEKTAEEEENTEQLGLV
jgi:uncharacterized protein (TIGR00375 family)